MANQRGGDSTSKTTMSSTPGPSALPTSEPIAGAAAQVASSDKPELPWAFIDCPADTLVILIAHMLDLLCQHNDQVVLTPDALTRFHSRAPPNITVIDYLRRIVKYTNLEKIPLLSLLAYIDLTCQNLPTFTLSSLTVHRFLIAGVTAGSKAQCDVFCTNSHYAKVGGIKVGELNSLEREFLRVTGWALCCNADLLQRYYTSLIRSHGGFRQAPEPVVSPFRVFPDVGKPTPESHAQDSTPATPVDVDDTAEPEEAMADQVGGSDYDSADEDDDEDEGCSANRMSVETSIRPTPTPHPARGRSRSRNRGKAMDVDSPEVRGITPTASIAPAGMSVAAHAAAPTRTGSADSAAKTSAHTSFTRDSLKQFVGGIFRRYDTATAPPNATPDKRLKSHPVGESMSAQTSPVVQPSPSSSASGSGVADMPKTLTPRVRTRDERSVDSLRSGAVPPPIAAADDSKRRARVE